MEARDGDALLVAAAREGRQDAYEALFRRHAGAVFVAARSRLREEDARDVVQETFARAYQRLGELRDPERFRPWLLAIARHAAADITRAARWSAPLPDDVDRLPADAPEPDRLSEIAALVTLVDGCMATLSKRDATVLALVGHLGFSPAEVAPALGVSMGASRVILHRARSRLRAAVDQSMGGRSSMSNAPTTRPLARTASAMDSANRAGDHATTSKPVTSGSGS